MAARNKSSTRNKIDDYKIVQEEEASTWLLDDEKARKEKAQREYIRYPLIKKQMGLEFLDTSDMVVWDIGGGPLGGVSSLLNCKIRLVIDPLTHLYAKYFDTTFYLNEQAENLKDKLSVPDLIIITNALDHFENPIVFLEDLSRYTKYGTYFAHLHAIDNSLTHRHKAHQYNVNPQLIDHYLKNDFELVWYMDFQKDGLVYGWRHQPAFSQLWRKIR